jgi:hypothetical protein
MVKPPKAVVAGAAVAGLLAGLYSDAGLCSQRVCESGNRSPNHGSDEKGKHFCKGQNEAKDTVDARAVTMVAKVRTLARAKVVAPLTEANPD